MAASVSIPLLSEVAAETAAAPVTSTPIAASVSTPLLSVVASETVAVRVAPTQPAEMVDRLSPLVATPGLGVDFLFEYLSPRERALLNRTSRSLRTSITEVNQHSAELLMACPTADGLLTLQRDYVIYGASRLLPKDVVKEILEKFSIEDIERIVCENYLWISSAEEILANRARSSLLSDLFSKSSSLDETAYAIARIPSFNVVLRVLLLITNLVGCHLLLNPSFPLVIASIALAHLTQGGLSLAHTLSSDRLTIKGINKHTKHPHDESVNAYLYNLVEPDDRGSYWMSRIFLALITFLAFAIATAFMIKGQPPFGTFCAILATSLSFAGIAFMLPDALLKTGRSIGHFTPFIAEQRRQAAEMGLADLSLDALDLHDNPLPTAGAFARSIAHPGAAAGAGAGVARR